MDYSKQYKAVCQKCKYVFSTCYDKNPFLIAQGFGKCSRCGGFISITPFDPYDIIG